MDNRFNDGQCVQHALFRGIGILLRDRRDVYTLFGNPSMHIPFHTENQLWQDKEVFRKHTGIVADYRTHPACQHTQYPMD